MTPLWIKVRALVGTSYAWLRVDAHRRHLYKRARVVIPVLVAAGYLTGGFGSDVLTVLAILAGAAVPHLAAKNV